ncbi:TraB/GumN family protein [uncultured Algimonas sp.]|uniref:TraB/GumN family protein n=1 Tax=uncultured Algimonas sp. TaxID=1547920 RepID=UPI00261E7EB1|nr:TraB/GumN family protein [uncultured Algimonas sp.]
MLRLILSFLAAATLTAACDRVPVTDGAMRKVEDARARNDGPALWRLQDEDSTLYLFGTVHLLPEDLRWQRDDMREAFAQSGTVFFEADHAGAAGLRAQALATQRGFRRDGHRLTDTLDNYQSILLEAVANNGGVDLAALDSMRPWLAGEFLTLAAADAAGLSAELSADEALKSRAARSGKNVVFLETAEAQIRQMADLPEAVQLELLTDTMERFEEMDDTLAAIARDWAVGDVDALEAALTGPLENAPDGYVAAVLTDRNAAWAERLDAFMDGSGTGFAAVGLSHLLGEDSLIDALEARGHDISRYLAFLGEDVIRPADLDLPDVPTD